MKKFIIPLVCFALTGCAGTTKLLDPMPNDTYTVDNPGKGIKQPKAIPVSTTSAFQNIPTLDGDPIVIAVYSFTDMTGQKKTLDNSTSLSTAVSQGSQAWIIDALNRVGDGSWFTVVERGGLDNIIKERQLIKNTRTDFQGDNAKDLPPMVFAGTILEGGIVSYDTNIRTGGEGARFLGLGADYSYREDIVTVFIRLVSVSTGEVLLSVGVQKTIWSYKVDGTLFKFVDISKSPKLLEGEVGYSANEPTNFATKAAVEQCVVEMIKEGERKGLWKFKE